MLIEIPQISLQPVKGLNTYQTMTVVGKAKNYLLHILVNSRTTHNLLDISLAKTMNCNVKRIPSLQVAVTHGQQLDCNTMCKDFTWSLLRQRFASNFFLVPLGSCEIMLEVQWLCRLGSFLWNFEELHMKFTHKGKRMVMRGTKKSNVEWMGGNKV